MAHGEATVLIRRPAEEVLEFVLDLRRYREVDGKIGAIHWLWRDGDTVTFRFRPKLFGLPGPAMTQRVVRTGDERVDVVPSPSVLDRVVRFSGSFVCAGHPDGTLVTRRMDLVFAPAVAAVADAVLTPLLVRDMRRELHAIRVRLERAAGG
ncbi:hypothetical protein Misp01_04220 [Microtetraspora sp. NBRC 13810]|uniref:SRPBCC family protein n=1 Tax=Microtetraspora sp. NBRC 13810 TaxID=3030990 RepID=UPI0024A407F1|nr:SRPBCC family protein [Microtetraspora sp. NBRC 13810]GLW05292.1 hypothetical protein Misp01_04220 [Microtetraspora sp. NBRC 13810]